MLLKPVAAADREGAWEQVFAAMGKAKWLGPGPEPSEDELLGMAAEEINEIRRDRARGGGR